MPNKTKNYNLTKPLPEEIYNIEDHNGNMDIIDTQLQSQSNIITTVKTQVDKNTKSIKNNSDEIEAIKAKTDTSSSSDNIATVTLSKDNWDSATKTQIVNVTGISEKEDYQVVQIAPSLTSLSNIAAYNNAGIIATSYAKNSITFTADLIPQEDIILLVSYEYSNQYIGDRKTAITAVTTTGTGSAYIATVPEITELTNGLQITIIPHVVSTSVNPTLNINSLGAKFIKQRIANTTNSVASGDSVSWLTANKPVVLCYDGTQWVTLNISKSDISSSGGVIPIKSGGTGASTAEGAREALGAEGKHKTQKVTLTVDGWGSDNTQTVTVNGVNASGSNNENDIFVFPVAENAEEWGRNAITPISQSDNAVTFKCSSIPNSSIAINVLFFM